MGNIFSSEDYLKASYKGINFELESIAFNDLFDVYSQNDVDAFDNINISQKLDYFTEMERTQKDIDDIKRIIETVDGVIA